MNNEKVAAELLMVAKSLTAGLSAKMKKLFEPLLEAHDSALKVRITKNVRGLRTKLRKKFKSEEDIKAAYKLADESAEKVPWRQRQMTRDKNLDADLKVWTGWGLYSRSIHNAGVYKKNLDRIIDESIKFNRAKLENAIDKNLGKLPIKEVEEVYSRRGVKGLQGRYLITLNRNIKGYFETKSISAGGHNIQRFHYRYIMKIDKGLKERMEKTPDAVDPKILEVLTILAKYKSQLKVNEPIPSKIRYDKVEKLKGGSRNWGPLIKAGLIQKIEFGNYYVRRYNYHFTDKGFAALKKV